MNFWSRVHYECSQLRIAWPCESDYAPRFCGGISHQARVTVYVSSHFSQQIKNMPFYWSSNLIQDNQPIESLFKLSNVNNPVSYLVQHDQDNTTPCHSYPSHHTSKSSIIVAPSWQNNINRQLSVTPILTGTLHCAQLVTAVWAPSGQPSAPVL